MENQEESEIIADFGQIVRTVMGSGMQAAEQAQRRAAMKAEERQIDESKERAVAQMIGRDFASDKFWKTAGSEAIADRMTVAVELATKHGANSEAARAFMTGADRIRNQYGINVEDINRDHPTASTDRHQALRDALDDYLAGERSNAEEQGLKGGLERQDEAAHTVQAKRAEGEENLDRVNTEAAEQGPPLQLLSQEQRVAFENTDPVEPKNVSAPQQPAPDVVKPDSQNLPQNQHSDVSHRILSVWREKSGGNKNPSIPKEPTVDAAQKVSAKRPRVSVGQASSRQQDQGISR